MPRSTVDASNASGSPPHVYEKRPRIPSHRLRELTRGKFIINYKDITLLESIGEGYNTNIVYGFLKLCSFVGEFGIVYKARLKQSSHEVAVKTLKGLQSTNQTLVCLYLHYDYVHSCV